MTNLFSELGKQAAYHEKQAIYVPLLPAMAGAVIGTARAPKGDRAEGFGRGVLAGIGTDIGATAGVLGGAALGAGAGVGIEALARALNLQTDRGSIPIGGTLAGTIAGGIGGAYGGLRLSQRAMGKPSWKRKEDKEEKE